LGKHKRKQSALQTRSRKASTAGRTPIGRLEVSVEQRQVGDVDVLHDSPGMCSRHHPPAAATVVDLNLAAQPPAVLGLAPIAPQRAVLVSSRSHAATGEGDLEDKAGVNDLGKTVRHTDAGNCTVASSPYSVRLPVAPPAARHRGRLHPASVRLPLAHRGATPAVALHQTTTVLHQTTTAPPPFRQPLPVHRCVDPLCRLHQNHRCSLPSAPCAIL
jgi:hypothetical protein